MYVNSNAKVVLCFLPVHIPDDVCSQSGNVIMKSTGVFIKFAINK